MVEPTAADARVQAVAGELAFLARRLDQLGYTLSELVGELRPAASTAPVGPVPTTVGPPVDAGRPPAGPRVSVPTDPARTSVSWPRPGEAYSFPIGPRPPTVVDRLRAVSGPALVATLGGAVTLLGVVLLLVLAASRGWFGPGARVAAGAALGLVLVGLGAWLHRRRAVVGAQALAGTGFVALFLTVAAATALYELVPPFAGAALALLVAAGGLAVADRWESRPLAVAAVVGSGLLTPFVADGPTALAAALALALQLAAAPVVLRRGWAAPGVVAAVWAALYGALAAFVADERFPVLVAVVLAALVVGSGATVAAVLGRVRAPAVAAILTGVPLPAFALATEGDGWSAAWVALVAATVATAFALWGRASAGVRATAAALAGIGLLLATVTALRGTPQHLVVLAEGIALLVAAAGLRSRALVLIGGGFGVCGLLLVLSDELPVDALVRAGQSSAVGLVAGLLVAAAAVAGLVAAGRLGWVRADAGTSPLWGSLALVALYGATGAVVAAAQLVEPSRDGFLVGHALVTVSWTVAALVLLARGIARPALRVAGLVLVAAAVGKLVLFDLVALDGLARVGAFLGAGLVLLAVGTRYARLVGERTE